MKEKMLLVDGYNMIAFWQSTKQAFRQGKLDVARSILLDKLSNYASFEQIQVICVFDAQHVPGLRQRYDAYNVTVIFTEEDETADSYIEKLSAKLNQQSKLVYVATSDLNEQWVVFSQGALRVSARELEKEIQDVKKNLDGFLSETELYTPRLTPWSQGQTQTLRNLMDDL
ncbi:NYN domain-containing protein [Streptococcus minor]|uniref:NYN domain-containing protein n=1 Tax=Streptococcus minor TaxID=229549 RepID=UPI000362E29C|nr:NYN domain-containing protein [Streptococcus minor]